MLRIVTGGLASLLLAATFGSASSAGASPGPSESSRAAVSADTVGVPTSSWCRTLLPERSTSAKRARQIMGGRVDLGMYGWFSLAQDPTWKPTPTLDASGNTHMHGLHWSVPLLYEGMATGDLAMVTRFYAILGSWWRAFPPTRPRTYAQDQPIISGERLWTLTCASDMAQAAGQDRGLWARVAATEAQRQLSRFGITRGTNNTAIHAQSGALAAFCQSGDLPKARAALSNLSALADYLVLADGSDREGSPHYAYYTYDLLGRTARIADKCAMPHPRIDAAMGRALGFLAHATRPDGTLETLGDSPGSRMNPALLPADSGALFARTKGAKGSAPTKLYRAFAGGYVFGRSSWSAQGGPSPTFYSLRTGRGPTPTAHTHSDIGSLTVNARGIQWIGDPGPWRYDRSPLRRAIVLRAAHSTLTVEPLRPRVIAPTPTPSPSVLPGGTPSASPSSSPASSGPSPSPSGSASPSPTRPPAWTPPAPKPNSRVTRARSNSTRDRTCIDDLTYPTVRITRCVTFRRDTREVTVEDRMTARARSSVSSRWQIPNGVKVTRKGHKVTLRSDGKRAGIALAGTPSGRVSTSRAWFTVRYGVKAAGTTITRSAVLEKGATATWRMTFTVR